ncbi:MAG: DUF2169 domain-containing protein [Nannocystaceae bacterium]
MPHPRLYNETPYVVEPLFFDDEDGDPVLVVVTKATFELQEFGQLALLEEQPGLELAGQCYGEDPETSSYRYEPECASFKPATDVVAIGHAHATRPNTTQLDVGLQVGPLRKVAWVFGERLWYRSAVEFVLTRPRPFERIPLTYERAFGGWDRSSPDPSHHAHDPRNPVGRGFHTRHAVETKDDYAPNIEDPRAPIRGYRDRPAPVGFGFTSPNWQPRPGFAGTYDEVWDKTRKPRLPRDFDVRYHNAAPEGLVAPGYLRGDELVRSTGLSPRGELSFSLPGLPPPHVRVSIIGQPDPPITPKLDTVILDFDQLRVTLLWRGRTKVPEGPHDVHAIGVESPPSLQFPRAITDPSGDRPAAN